MFSIFPAFIRNDQHSTLPIVITSVFIHEYLWSNSIHIKYDAYATIVAHMSCSAIAGQFLQRNIYDNVKSIIVVYCTASVDCQLSPKSFAHAVSLSPLVLETSTYSDRNFNISHKF